jgi:vacuolar-type H+-ATPase subunit D/Vma8
VLVKAANSEMEEERNEMNWKIVEKDRKQISSMIEGVGRITSMNDVTMTCANVCGVQLAIIDVSTSKPILYQFAWKLIKFIENKKQNLDA